MNIYSISMCSICVPYLNRTLPSQTVSNLRESVCAITLRREDEFPLPHKKRTHALNLEMQVDTQQPELTTLA